MSWCDPRETRGMHLDAWHRRYLALDTRRGRRLARQGDDRERAASEAFSYGRRGPASGRRRVVRQLAPTACVDRSVPYFVERWGCGGADA